MLTIPLARPASSRLPMESVEESNQDPSMRPTIRRRLRSIIRIVPVTMVPKRSAGVLEDQPEVARADVGRQNIFAAFVTVHLRADHAGRSNPTGQNQGQSHKDEARDLSGKEHLDENHNDDQDSSQNFCEPFRSGRRFRRSIRGGAPNDADSDRDYGDDKPISDVLVPIHNLVQRSRPEMSVPK